MFYILAIENNVSFIDLTILTISDDLGNLVPTCFECNSKTFYRRTGTQKRMEQKQLLIKP